MTKEDREYASVLRNLGNIYWNLALEMPPDKYKEFESLGKKAHLYISCAEFLEDEIKPGRVGRKSAT